MSTSDKNHELREHLALISTEAYLLMKASNEEERTKRYKMVQEEIKAILNLIDDNNPPQYSCSDLMIQ